MLFRSLFPGYVTEKSLEAWLGAAIPVYWGSDDYGVLNKKAIVNCRDYSTLREAADHVAGLRSNFETMTEIIREPILRADREPPDLIGFLRKGIEESPKFKELFC